MIKIKSDKIITSSGLFNGFLYSDNGIIIEISKNDKPADTEYNFSGYYVSPGFIDMHTHGGGGFPFINCSVSDVINGCNFHLKHGTTSILPTVTAGSFKTMADAVANIKEAKKSGKAPNILGAHLEGPYLSKVQAGAQCTDFITPPVKEDYENLISKHGDIIKRWTYAPENDIDSNFCRYLSEHGILPSAGHSDATYEDMVLAVKNGCKLITHLYSCTSTVTRKNGFRSLGVIESAFLLDELFVEIIADGRHLPPELIKMIIKIKGADKVALTTDSLEIAGTDVLAGVMSGTSFIVEDGVCKLSDRSAFAGSIATADMLIRTLVFDCDIPVLDAVKMLTEVPAKILGINKGVLSVGKDADITIFDEKINTVAVFIGG